MTDTTTGPATASASMGLAERARAAAAHRADGGERAWFDPRWLTAAHTCAQRLSVILAVPADRIRIQASTARRYGGWPWVELTVTDTDRAYRFTAAYPDPERITALQPCAFCDAEVPTFPIRTLADLGDVLTGDTDYTNDEPIPAFYQDPGHKPDCYAATAA